MSRLLHIPGFSIDKVAGAAEGDSEVLRLENLDTDLKPPVGVIEATRNAVGRDDHNSYLPFVGKIELRKGIATRLRQSTGKDYNENNVVITCGGTTGLLNSLLTLSNPGDEVILTDPTYAGMIHRVSLVGASPVFVRFNMQLENWKLDLQQLNDSISRNTKLLFIMSPSMPSGAVLSSEDWQEIARLCEEHNLQVIYNAAMERILYDERKVFHPCSIPGMSERTLIVGSFSKEYRMIGWRVGWVAGPQKIINDVAKASIYNAVTISGFAQEGAIQALQEPDANFKNCLEEWNIRRDILNEQLSGYPMISAAGGWSQIMDVGKMGYTGAQVSQLLLEKGKIAATPMTHWGNQNSEQFIRFVFSNESTSRLQTVKERFQRAFA